jgi:hypothetical protein
VEADTGYDPNHRVTNRDAEDAALPVYQTDEACIKCVTRRMVDANGAPIIWHRVEYVPASDMLRVTCGECGYVWARRPDDDQPCTYSFVVDLAMGDKGDGKRFCSLRAGHNIDHDFTTDPVPDRNGSPW